MLAYNPGRTHEDLSAVIERNLFVGAFILPDTLSFHPGLLCLSDAGHRCARAADPGIYVCGLCLMLAARRPSALDDYLGARRLVSRPRHRGTLPLQRTADAGLLGRICARFYQTGSHREIRGLAHRNSSPALGCAWNGPFPGRVRHGQREELDSLTPGPLGPGVLFSLLPQARRGALGEAASKNPQLEVIRWSGQTEPL